MRFLILTSEHGNKGEVLELGWSEKRNYLRDDQGRLYHSEYVSNVDSLREDMVRMKVIVNLYNEHIKAIEGYLNAK